VLAAHCSWALCTTAACTSKAASALFTDVRSAYYSVVRQLVVGALQQDDALRAILARLPLTEQLADRGQWCEQVRLLM
jgi:hypothetical protein